MTRWFAFLAVFALAFVASSPAPAQAAPGQPVPIVAISGFGTITTPAIALLDVTVTCVPSPTETGFMFATLAEPSTQSVSSDFVVVTCDFRARTYQMRFVGLWVPGEAFAMAQACTQVVCGMDARKVTLRLP